MSDTITIPVYREEFRTALRHAMQLWWSDSTPKKRLDQRGGRDGFTRYCNARVEGKLAEVAFSRFLDEEFGIESEVDWRIYDDYEATDNGDVRCLITDDGEEVEPAVEFDVKKTKFHASWLALRSERFEAHPDDAPYVCCTMDLRDDVDVDEWQPWEAWPADDWKFEQRLRDYEEEWFPLDVSLEGAVYKDEFTHQFDAGEKLHAPGDPDFKFNATMRMDNTAVAIEDIPCTPDRWNRVVGDIVGDHDITWDTMDGYGGGQ